MSEDAGDPSALAAAATGGNPSGGPDPSPAPEPEDSGGGRNIRGSLLEGLLSTDPPGEPEDYPDLEEYHAHALIGAKKFLNGATGGKVPKGTTAAENFARAGLGWFRQLPDPEEGGGEEW